MVVSTDVVPSRRSRRRQESDLPTPKFKLLEVLLSDSPLVGRSVGQSFCISSLKGGKLHFHAPFGALV